MFVIHEIKKILAASGPRGFYLHIMEMLLFLVFSCIAMKVWMQWGIESCGKIFLMQMETTKNHQIIMETRRHPNIIPPVTQKH